MKLTYAHIEELFHWYQAELTRRLLAMVNSRDAAADLFTRHLRATPSVHQYAAGRAAARAASPHCRNIGDRPFADQAGRTA